MGAQIGKLLKVNSNHVSKFQPLHVAFSGRNGSGLFQEDIFQVFCRYAGSMGHSFHRAISSAVFACLRNLGRLWCKCFVSPLNCYVAPFSSVSLADVSFKSLGSFFNFDPVHGSYKVNPSFVDIVLSCVVDNTTVLLLVAVGLVSSVFAVPGWIDSGARQCLGAVPYSCDRWRCYPATPTTAVDCPLLPCMTTATSTVTSTHTSTVTTPLSKTWPFFSSGTP